MVDGILKSLDVPHSFEIEQLIKFDVARVSSYFETESRAPTTAQRAAALHKVVRQADRVRAALMTLELAQYETVSLALLRLPAANVTDAISALLFARTAIVQLRIAKNRVARTRLDRALQASPRTLLRLDDYSESDLFDGMLCSESRPEPSEDPSAIDILAYCLNWIARGGRTILPTVSKPGANWTPGLHTAINLLAPRYKQLTGKAASYWGAPDDVPPNTFQTFVVLVFEQAKIDSSLDQIRLAIRTHCHARNSRLNASETGASATLK